ncbi:hypothetical protein [Modestobacter lapidis]|nr:hypothetical protein [Modestobacter lapidis]
MLTALIVDTDTAARRGDLAWLARDAHRGASTHDLLDQFADLAHAAEAAARRRAVGR